MDNNTPDVFDDVESEEGDLDHKKDDEYDDDDEDIEDQDESEEEYSTDTEHDGRP